MQTLETKYAVRIFEIKNLKGFSDISVSPLA